MNITAKIDNISHPVPSLTIKEVLKTHGVYKVQDSLNWCVVNCKLGTFFVCNGVVNLLVPSAWNDHRFIKTSAKITLTFTPGQE